MKSAKSEPMMMEYGVSMRCEDGIRQDDEVRVQWLGSIVDATARTWASETT